MDFKQPMQVLSTSYVNILIVHLMCKSILTTVYTSC